MELEYVQKIDALQLPLIKKMSVKVLKCEIAEDEAELEMLEKSIYKRKKVIALKKAELIWRKNGGG